MMMASSPSSTQNKHKLSVILKNNPSVGRQRETRTAAEEGEKKEGGEMEVYGGILPLLTKCLHLERQSIRKKNKLKGTDG